MDTLKISNHLNWYQYSNKLVIRNLNTSEIYSLTDSMKEVWLLISKGYNRDTIYQSYSNTQNIPVNKCKTDIDDIIYILKDMKLIDNFSHNSNN
ncbi:MAG: hypothetical protein JEZ08_00470 [Clostridiales bacterium]|nr:hypothetical protein [Clostridiales bacterium]